MTEKRPAIHLSHLTRLCLGLGALTFTSASMAQALEEVVVTALRVESNVQKTPIAMEVLDSDALKDQGIVNVATLAAVSPSVNITGFGGGTVLTVRGVSSRDTTEIGDPAVVVSVDGFYQDRSYALGLSQYDLARMEILRGPQGTLYGRNATGGAINMFTVRPSKEAGGYAQADFGNYGAINAEGAINVPFGDRVQMRASFGSLYHDGYRDGGFFGKMDDANSRSGRLQFAFQPTENLDLWILAQHTKQTSLGNSANLRGYNVLPATTCNMVAAGAVPARTGPCQLVNHSAIPELGDPQVYTKYYMSQLNLDDTVVKWNATLRTPIATITYLGGYDRLDWDSYNPGATFPSPLNVATVQANFATVYNQTEKPRTTNHELRFQSVDPDARLTWQFGAFYFKNDNDLDSFNQRPNGTANPTPVIHFIYDVGIKSLAEMAQVAFKVTDDFKVTAGFRHNKDEKSRQGYFGGFQYLPPTQPLVISPGSDISKNTYHLGLDWQLNPDSLLYAKYGTGYKSGGFTDIAPYGPEEIKTYEVGSKNRFFNNQVQLNLSAYRSDYSGQQVQQIVQGGGGLKIENAGETKLQGLEAELTMSSDLGQLEFNLAYLDAEFTKFDLAYGAPVFDVTRQAWASLATVNVDLSGNRPQQAPEWTIGAAVQRSFNVWDGELTTRVQTKYQTEQFYTFFNRPDDMQKAYATINFLATYAPTGSPWQFQAYVNNLSNETVFSNAGPNDRSFVYSYTYQAPRTYGGRVSYKW
ncbi:MAG: TonB-dependent receptor [Steroidobacteraceae bacterium]